MGVKLEAGELIHREKSAGPAGAKAMLQYSVRCVKPSRLRLLASFSLTGTSSSLSPPTSIEPIKFGFKSSAGIERSAILAQQTRRANTVLAYLLSKVLTPASPFPLPC